MPTTPIDILSLTDRLASEGDTTITDAERRAIVAALSDLASSTLIRAKQESLLRSYGEDAREIEHLALRGIALATDHASSRAADQTAAIESIASAREALADEVRRSTDLRAIIRAAIRFAVTLATPV